MVVKSLYKAVMVVLVSQYLCHAGWLQGDEIKGIFESIVFTFNPFLHESEQSIQLPAKDYRCDRKVAWPPFFFKNFDAGLDYVCQFLQFSLQIQPCLVLKFCRKWLGLVDFLQSQKVLDYFFAARFIKDIGVHPIAFQPDGCGEMKFADNCF